jgi:hypothetical protein
MDPACEGREGKVGNTLPDSGKLASDGWNRWAESWEVSKRRQ